MAVTNKFVTVCVQQSIANIDLLRIHFLGFISFKWPFAHVLNYNLKLHGLI